MPTLYPPDRNGVSGPPPPGAGQLQQFPTPRPCMFPMAMEVLLLLPQICNQRRRFPRLCFPLLHIFLNKIPELTPQLNAIKINKAIVFGYNDKEVFHTAHNPTRSWVGSDIPKASSGTIIHMALWLIDTYANGRSYSAYRYLGARYLLSRLQLPWLVAPELIIPEPSRISPQELLQMDFLMRNGCSLLHVRTNNAGIRDRCVESAQEHRPPNWKGGELCVVAAPQLVRAKGFGEGRLGRLSSAADALSRGVRI